MENVNVPGCGRIVHFSPVTARDQRVIGTGASKVPAIVVEGDDTHPSLSVFTVNAERPVVVRKTVPHVSLADKDAEGNFTQSYWEWPEVVAVPAATTEQPAAQEVFDTTKQ